MQKKGDRVGAIKYTLVHLKCTHDVSIWKFANNMKEKHTMQYTLRCRDVKNRVGALEVHVKILRRIQRRREKNVKDSTPTRLQLEKSNADAREASKDWGQRNEKFNADAVPGKILWRLITKNKKVHYTLRCRVVKIASEHVRYAKKWADSTFWQARKKREGKEKWHGWCCRDVLESADSCHVTLLTA